MKIKSILVLITLLVGLAASAQQGTLDGKTFKIELMKDGIADSKETLVFDKGMMDPLDCHQWGFTAAPYQGKYAAGLSAFRAICTSEKEGTMTWQGKVTGDKIEGSISWTKEGQDTIYYTFKGTAEAVKK